MFVFTLVLNFHVISLCPVWRTVLSIYCSTGLLMTNSLSFPLLENAFNSFFICIFTISRTRGRQVFFPFSSPLEIPFPLSSGSAVFEWKINHHCYYSFSISNVLSPLVTFKISSLPLAFSSLTMMCSCFYVCLFLIISLNLAEVSEFVCCH